MRIDLTDADLGLIVTMLLSDRLEHGEPMRYENILTHEVATTDTLLVKLIAARNPSELKRGHQ